MKKIIAFSKLYDMKLYIPKDIQERLQIKDRDGIIWYIDENNKIFIDKNIIEDKKVSELEKLYTT